MMKFSEFIRALREKKGFSQIGLADFLGFHFNTVSRWERGQQAPANNQLRKVSLRTGKTFLELWIMVNSKNPFVIPVFSASDLKNPLYRLLTNTTDERAFWLLVDKKLEKQTKSVFKDGDLLLVEPSMPFTSSNWILKNGKLKKASVKEKGAKVSLKLSKV